MNWLVNLLIVIQLLSALSIIILVLLQHGKGADMGAAFGSGASGSLFGASGSANFLSRTTAVLASVFFVATVGIAHWAKPHAVDEVGAGVMGAAPGTSPASTPAPPVSAPAKGKDADIPK
jgi:preprotein translocase subunit SecG